MTAIGRALMAQPSMILLDEPSMGLAPQIVEEIFEIVQRPEPAGEACRSCSPSRTRSVALRYADYGYILENGRVVMDGDARELAAERGREGVLPRPVDVGTQELPRRQALPPQASAGWHDAIDVDALGDSTRRLGARREPG